MPKNKIKLEISVDDGSELDLVTIHLLTEYGLEKYAIFYIPVICDLTDYQIRYLSNHAKIGGHTLSHTYLTEVDLDTAKTEVEVGKIRLEEIIGKEITSFCYPRGRYNDQIKKIVKDAGFTEARTTKVLWTSVEDPFEKHTTIHVYPRSEYDGKDWFEVAINKWEEVKKNGGYYHLWFHSWEVDKFNNWQKLEMLFKKISEELK